MLDITYEYKCTGNKRLLLKVYGWKMKDIQSWWEVPSIAYYCSLFRTAFDLLDFDIEELEEALLTDGTEESASSLLTELIVQLLNGCLGNNDISAFNYQMYLRRLFRRKCQETGRCNPFNTDIDFQFLPLRTKVEILYALCDFRLDADDVYDLFKNLEADSLRVDPLGWDDNGSAYWYFFGTRLYREDNLKKSKRKKKKVRKRGWLYEDDWFENDTERVWQVVCFTEEDWAHLTEKFSKATSKIEKELYRSLSQNFLPEIPRLFREKEKLQRKRLLELPRRTSSRVLQKIKQKEEENKQNTHDVKDEYGDDEESKETSGRARENRAKRRNLLRSKSVSSDSSDSSEVEQNEMPLKALKQATSQEKKPRVTTNTDKGEPPPGPPVKTGRKTNNSLASATGQILIPDNDEPVNSTRKKLKTSQIFSQTDEDIQTDMYKVLEQLTAHEDAWPFMDPVEEEYAPNYYAVIRRPMDLRKMEERLDSGYYTDFSMFKADFKLIVNNCRLYNGQDNEYTVMVDNLQTAFDRLTEKYMHRLSSSDEEIAVEYQLPTPSRKHKTKSSESTSHHKRKKSKSHSDTGEPRSSTSEVVQEEEEEVEEEKIQSNEIPELEIKKPKESHKNKDGKIKKKRKGHHRHGKHSKNHKKSSFKSDHSELYKSKHGKKQKHSKNKESKKSKQKKKKSKHHESESNENLNRTMSHESLESSNRSRSASPLPSIHSPTPSPTELDQSGPQEQLADPDFFKDKYDKIKERRRHAAKDAWDSLFEYKQKVDKQKQNLNIPEKDKNQKLRETIEKLKAKNEKYKDNELFNNLFSPNQGIIDKISELSNTNDSSNKDSDDVEDEIQKNKFKKGQKKNTAKNESASEALEQAVKDISKWLEDAPKSSTLSSPSNSPAQTISTEEQDNSRLDDESSQGEKSLQSRKETSRKRLSSREPKFLKRREVQRTIERLQPGKSKGNLLTNISTKAEKMEEVVTHGPLNKVRDSVKVDESSPKLSLGSVLPTVEFTLGTEHAFGNNEEKSEEQKAPVSATPVIDKIEKEEDKPVEKKTENVQVQSNKKDVEVETEPPSTLKPSQEKATPNLSAWFKAFGAPKNTPSTSTSVKKKVDDTETEEKTADVPMHDSKAAASPKIATKYDSATDPDTPNPDGGDSPLLNVSATPRQRRTSTGSSVSERSSFSQDLDSPRHQMSHTSPLLHSPASPRTEDFQKITYPIINGTVRAGFYHDTTSIKSSPEKSCSPREAPQSPYSPYSQHVYLSNNIAGSSTPNYFIDHSKSPLSTYSQNPASFYDTSKPPAVNKTIRPQDDYATLNPESYQQNQYTNQFAHSYSPYKQQPPSTYSQIQHVTQQTTATSVTAPPAQISADVKSTLFPVKKRTYNEPEQTATNNKASDAKDVSGITQNKNENHKITQSIHSMSSLSTTSVDDIALALSEKSEMSKLNSLRQKLSPDYVDRRIVDNRENNEPAHDKKETNVVDSNKPLGIMKKDNIDMVNMGYLNNDTDRRQNGDSRDDYNARDVSKTNTISPQKVYDIDAMALNLGINTQFTKPKNSVACNIPPAHSQHSDINLSQMMAHAHHNQYDPIPSGQAVSSFSINDIELANKKLFASNVPSTSSAIDYGNWKPSNQIRKQEMLPSDYSTSYNVNSAEKLKNDLSVANSSALNFNKNSQHQQYNAYNVPRTNPQRVQDLQQNLPAELRIPNPRGLLKNDHLNVSSSIVDADLLSKNIDSHAKSQKAEKLVQSHPLVTSNPYKAPYTNHSSIPLESLRNLSSIPQMLERYNNDERYLSSFASGSSSLYHEKQYQMAQMFNKTMTPEANSTSSSIPMQASASITKDSGGYKSSALPAQQDTKSKNKRRKISETKSQIVSNQSYHAPPCGSDVLSTVKTSMLPGSAFNFGTTPNMTLGSSIYGDNGGFSIEDFRNTTASQLMAANYMAAAVARQQQNSVEDNADKLVKPAHQNSGHSTGSFPYIGHTQVRAGYPFVNTDPQAPLYHRYLQQQEILRHTGAQIMGLYPSGYPAGLGVRQPYDSINRPSWL